MDYKVFVLLLLVGVIGVKSEVDPEDAWYQYDYGLDIDDYDALRNFEAEINKEEPFQDVNEFNNNNEEKGDEQIDERLKDEAYNELYDDLNNEDGNNGYNLEDKLEEDGENKVPNEQVDEDNTNLDENQEIPESILEEIKYEEPENINDEAFEKSEDLKDSEDKMINENNKEEEAKDGLSNIDENEFVPDSIENMIPNEEIQNSEIDANIENVDDMENIESIKSQNENVDNEDDQNKFDQVEDNRSENDEDSIPVGEDGFEPDDAILQEAKDLLAEIDQELKLEDQNESEENKLNPNAQQDNEQYEAIELAIDNVDENNDIGENVVGEEINESEEQQDENNDDVAGDLFDDYDSDTVAKVYSDLKEDLNSLFDVVDRLAESESDEKDTLDIKDYEDKFNKPYREDNVMQLRKENNEDIEDYEKNEEDLPNLEIPEEMPNLDDDGLSKPNDMEEKTEDKLKADVESLATKQKLDALTDDQVAKLIEQFKAEHSEDLDVFSDNFDKYIAPVYVTLKVDEPTIITSPNYPSPYPTNNIVDWIFEGEGVGIEMNITDFYVNGYIGDYLLVKPGNLDDGFNDGLVFSYNLNSEKRYRFMDLNKMVMRFESKTGMAFSRGFSISLRSISPLPEEVNSDVEPQPEETKTPPTSTHTIYLEGRTLEQINNITADIKFILEDMTIYYLNSINMDLGNRSDIESATQIVHKRRCNINWPGFHVCAEIQFGVENEMGSLSRGQLRDMWDNYSGIDPFAARLRRLGLKQYSMPRESTTLLAWLVIALGVALSAAMLALALWRWSCFEDYTRMKSYSGSDSLYGDEKKDPDLYPTPHQTLPPLYDDDFKKYEDSTRVDMGGYTNKSFARDNLFELDSDDETVGGEKQARFVSDV